MLPRSRAPRGDPTRACAPRRSGFLAARPGADATARADRRCSRSSPTASASLAALAAARRGRIAGLLAALETRRRRARAAARRPRSRACAAPDGHARRCSRRSSRATSRRARPPRRARGARRAREAIEALQRAAAARPRPRGPPDLRASCSRADADAAPRLSSQVFAILSALVEERTGLHYGPRTASCSPSKVSARAEEAGFDRCSTTTTSSATTTRRRAELDALVDALVVSETLLLPRARRRCRCWSTDFVAPRGGRGGRRPRIWSAACATGEEPLTLAMLLAERGVLGPVELVASDISARALERARARALRPRARCAQRARRRSPARYLRQRARRQRSRHAASCASAIHWRRVNLIDAAAVRALGPFDVVLCRNVLIYFSDATARRVVDALADALRPGGVLLVGVSESLLRFGTQLACEEHGGVFFYRKAPMSDRPHPRAGGRRLGVRAQGAARGRSPERRVEVVGIARDGLEALEKIAELAARRGDARPGDAEPRRPRGAARAPRSAPGRASSWSASPTGQRARRRGARGRRGRPRAQADRAGDRPALRAPASCVQGCAGGAARRPAAARVAVPARGAGAARRAPTCWSWSAPRPAGPRR